ncbi:hypothetical protein D9M72_86170 [compost metagenome]
MTVPSQTPVTEHIANGATTLFPFGFLCYAASDLEVLADLVPVSSADYTVSGLNVPTGGSVNFQSAPDAGVKITIRLAVVLERTTDYQTSGDLLAMTVNRDFDRLWLAQQSSAVDISSSVKFPPGEQAGYLPAVDDRRGKALVFNAITGEPEPSVDDYNDQAAAAAASAQAAEASNQGAASAAGVAISAAEASAGFAADAAASAEEAAEALTNIAAHVTLVPAGGISATNVQDALYELDEEKASKDAATTIAAGLVELATAAEVLAGTDAQRAVTPAGLLAGLLGAGTLSGTTGYLIIPVRSPTSGARENIVVQYGVTGNVADAATAAVTFPIQFPTACLLVLATNRGAAAGNFGGCTATVPTTTGCSVGHNNGAGNSSPIAWFSIGN